MVAIGPNIKHYQFKKSIQKTLTRMLMLIMKTYKILGSGSRMICHKIHTEQMESLSVDRFYFVIKYQKLTLFIISINHTVIFSQKQTMDPSKHAPLRINDIRSKYKVIDKVGKGTYGTVFKVLNLQDNKYYAIKKFENTDVKLQVQGFPITALRGTVRHIIEISLLKQLNHPNIVNLKEIICSKPNKRNLYRGSTFMVFQYMHHDFAGLFRSKIKFSVPQIKCIMKQLLSGCSFLHKNKVMHRDIKSANILMNDQGVVQLADFGLGRRTRFESVYTYKVVTLWYRAPELLLGCKTYNHKVDVWSIGCVFAELLIGEVLFKKQTQYAIIEKIYEVCGDLQENEFTEQYLRGCVYYNDMKPKKPSKNTLSAFVKKINPNIDDLSIKFLQGLLELNPYKRLSCEQALQHEYFREDPKACEPQQIHKLEVEYHEMFRDRSLKIDRKTRKQSLNWSEEEQLRKGKQDKGDSEDKKVGRYGQKESKPYSNRIQKEKSYNDRPYERRTYSSRYGSRYDDRKHDYVQREHTSSRYYEDYRYKKRHQKSVSHSISSQSSSSRSKRSRSRNTKRHYYQDKGRQYNKREQREKIELSENRKQSRHYDDDKSRQKQRSYGMRQKHSEQHGSNSKGYQQRPQSYKKDYYVQQSKGYKQRGYQSKDMIDRREYGGGGSRTEKYQRSYQKSGQQKQRYPEEGKSRSYQNEKHQDYHQKDQYKPRQDEFKQRNYDYRYEGEHYRARRDDVQKPYKQDYDRYSRTSYSTLYKPPASDSTKKQYQRQYQYHDDKDKQLGRQYEKVDYSRKSSRYNQGYKYKEDYRYQQSSGKYNYREDSKYRDDPKYRDQSRYRTVEDKGRGFLNKKVSIQSRQSTQQKKPSPSHKAMDVEQY